MLHSHTQFCDGHAPMATMAEAAYAAGLTRYGFSPHSPFVPGSPYGSGGAREIPLTCNMHPDRLPEFLAEADRLKNLWQGRLEILTGMEIDYISPECCPASAYYQEMPLDYRIGSVHFVTTRDGTPVDCDGSATRFADYLQRYFGGDTRYVVEKYFDSVREMIALGGFDILGHADKIAGNAAAVMPDVENQDWYRRLVNATLCEAVDAGLVIEINTKAFADRHRFYPAEHHWPLLRQLGARVTFHSDAHDPAKVLAGLADARFRY